LWRSSACCIAYPRLAGANTLALFGITAVVTNRNKNP
jgi:hypothetical protein